MNYLKPYILFLNLLLIQIIFSQFNNIVKMKSVKCSINSDFVGNYSCKIKPTRDGIGLLTQYLVLKMPLNDIWYHGKLYYKFRVYRPFMIEYDLDVCSFLSGKSTSSVFAQLYVHSFKYDAPEYVHPCPYKGKVGIYDVNVTKACGVILPQVVPSGVYKLVQHYHNTDNVTYFYTEVEIEIKASDPMKKFDIGR